jgi:hypothetical protein
MPSDARGPLPPPQAPPPAPSSASKLSSTGSNRRLQISAPTPSPEGFMSTSAKMSLADYAFALRDEQLEAKVVHYKAHLETSPELDAVTQQVVKDLQALQAAARAKAPLSRPPPGNDRAQLEIDLIQSLKEMLARIFRPNKLATVIERKLGEVSKRFARIFFESELHERIKGEGEEAKAMRFADQALYHAFVRTQDQVIAVLDEYQYANEAVQTRAKDHYYGIIKQLRNDFLARTTPELNTLVKFLNEVLNQFFTVELPPMLGELSWEVVKEAKLADARTGAGYKISASAFPTFRSAFERKFLQRLVPFVEDEMLSRVRDSMSQFRSETIRFVADPLIFSDVCEVVCESIYDMLYNDGFLDLPNDWRARLAAEG